ncbi:baseplate hub domain-containing protein [Devosia rhizoryzae]|uniref:baseplate hub domain-containing protein n=1 Tax=Devosia rhizoryzae TaxID=2774137 RepID=UPI003899439A
MRAVADGFAAHLAQGETTTAHCWRVLRSDGVVLGFTDHDRALVVEGTRCAPMHGFDGGEVPGAPGGTGRDGRGAGRASQRGNRRGRYFARSL